MSLLSRSAGSIVSGRGRLLLAAIALAVVCPVSAVAQERWNTTDDEYDGARVASSIDHVRARLEERHGSLASALFAENDRLSADVHWLGTRLPGPRAERIQVRVEAAHLMHYQAMNGGSLGTVHGTSEHPLGIGWFPHSMFAQSGRLFAQWGHARLLAAVAEHAERHQN